MPLPNIFTSCFRGPDETTLHTFPSIYYSVAKDSSAGCGAPLVAASSGAGRHSCVLKDEDASSPDGRNISYNPGVTSQTPSFCIELHQQSTQKLPGQSSNVEYTTADELVKDVQNLRWLGQGAQGVVYEGTWQGATVAVKFSIVEDLDATAYELMFSRSLSHPNVVQTFMSKVAVLDEKTIHPRTEGCSREPSMRNSITSLRCTTARLGDPVAAKTIADVTLMSSLYQRTQQAAEGTSLSAAAGPNPAVARCGSSGDGAVLCQTLPGANTAGACSDCCTSAGAQYPVPAGVVTVGASCKLGVTEVLQGGPQLLQQQQQQQQQGQHRQPLARSDSFRSDDGFGNPYGRKSSFNDVREVLAAMGARPGHFITQMVMEHCDHGSLHSAIQRGIFKPSSRWGPKLALRALIRTVREVAQGMFHLHSNNILHGDLKPANVLLINSRKDRRGYVAKVSDFGMAQFCPQDHISNAPWGTLVYMAPERLLQGQLFPASDVYSFGVILWEMYHGRRPYEGMHEAQIVMACAQGCTCLEWSEDSCSEIARIGLACMAPSPHDRPTFEYLMHELASLEARVRMDGVRVSKSLDRGSNRPSGRLSFDAAALQYARTRTSSGVPVQRASLDVTLLSSSSVKAAANATAIAAPFAAAATATKAGAPINRCCSHTSATAAYEENQAGGRHSTHTCCEKVSHHLSGCHVQHPRSGGGSNHAVPATSVAVPLPLSVPEKHTAHIQSVGGTADSSHAGKSSGAGGQGVGMFGAGGSNGDTGVLKAVEKGRRSGDDSAAAIAAALAQQPSIASAVVSELLALLHQQPPAEEQQQQQQKQAAAAGDRGFWAADPSAINCSSGVAEWDLWRLNSGGLGVIAPPPSSSHVPPSPCPTFQPTTPDAFSPSRLIAPSSSVSYNSSSYHNVKFAVPPEVSSSLQQQPQRSSSCGGRALLCSTQAASPAADLGMHNTDTADMATAADAVNCIARSSTDSVLDSSRGGPASHGDVVVGLEGVGTASLALSSPGHCLAAVAMSDKTVLQAVSVVRDPSSAAVTTAATTPQQQQQSAQATVATCGGMLVRRRSSNSSMSRWNSNLPGWECTTITEEPI